MERHSYRTLKGHQREKCCMRLGETRPCITWHDLNKIWRPIALPAQPRITSRPHEVSFPSAFERRLFSKELWQLFHTWNREKRVDANPDAAAIGSMKATLPGESVTEVDWETKTIANTLGLSLKQQLHSLCTETTNSRSGSTRKNWWIGSSCYLGIHHGWLGTGLWPWF